MKRLICVLLIFTMLIGCGRRLPPDCREVIDAADFGRFEIRDGGIAFDPDFDVEWFRCSVGERFVNDRCVGSPMFLQWEDGVITVEEMNEKVAGRWRLPSLDELASLKVKGCGNPSVNTNVFPSILVENYWAIDKSPHYGFRCGTYTYSGATSCRLFDNLERPLLIVRDIEN
ncbi:MAG: DUF1566 domain-containing protein [Candidatus Azotimanducaceae bacterium]|uniref:DUF1566 domain-containing protein n=1 Tax=OM182 bacterium TaxID=2510334 RepID=A0A520RZE2_9GAMM|nr:hypothetical protein [Gammaproteobacteria bacterium]OUV67411.1 MAG: hypothetical protein CBC93_05150 [Gammaproteobacteria bacterium TMED133]RZO75593.1 MAG: DUF1566 domain-containing protein [OM182 bacterium]